jgi:hypothetical protein
VVSVFLWKPLIILEELRSLTTGDFLFYLDSGCHLNELGRRRFAGYLSALNGSKEDLLLFEFRPPESDFFSVETYSSFSGLNDVAYAKSDVLEAFTSLGLTTNDFESPSIQGGIMLIQKSTKSLELIEKWADEATRRPELFDDTLAVVGEAPEFVSHRHFRPQRRGFPKSLRIQLIGDVCHSSRSTPVGIRQRASF